MRIAEPRDLLLVSPPDGDSMTTPTKSSLFTILLRVGKLIGGKHALTSLTD
jgi:hypothetical protein